MDISKIYAADIENASTKPRVVRSSAQPVLDLFAALHQQRSGILSGGNSETGPAPDRTFSIRSCRPSLWRRQRPSRHIPRSSCTSTFRCCDGNAGDSASIRILAAFADDLRKAQQITVRILDRELLDANLITVPPIPSLFEWQKDCNAGRLSRGVQTVDIGDFNLKIDASPKWMRQLRARPKPVLARRLLKHQLGPLTREIGKALFRAGIQDAKSKQLRVEAKAFREIRADQFGNELGAHDGSFTSP